VPTLLNEVEEIDFHRSESDFLGFAFLIREINRLDRYSTQHFKEVCEFHDQFSLRPPRFSNSLI